MTYSRSILLLVLFSSIFSLSSEAKNRAPIQRDVDYINQYKYLAISESNRSGIPASITLAQGILESASGTSRLATQGNNHFGIKCHKGWTGGKMYHDDDAKGECFRTYASADQSFRDHSDFLTGRSRYSDLFKLWKGDHVGWAYGLKKAGYATNPKYPQLLLALIDRYNLKIFDSGDNIAIGNYAMSTLNGTYSSSTTASSSRNYSPTRKSISKASTPTRTHTPITYSSTIQSAPKVATSPGKITYYPPKKTSPSSNSTYSQSRPASTSSAPFTSSTTKNSSAPSSSRIEKAKSYMGTTVTNISPAESNFKKSKKSVFRKSSKKESSKVSKTYTPPSPPKSSPAPNPVHAYNAPAVSNPIAAKATSNFKSTADISSSTAFRSVEYNKLKAVIYDADISLQQVSADHGTSMKKLASYNNVNENVTIIGGTKIYLESKKSKAGKQFSQHKVRDKETMQDISQNYGVKLEELYDKNQMPKGTQPKAGEYINLRDKRRWTPRIRTEDFTPLFVKSGVINTVQTNTAIVQSSPTTSNRNPIKTHQPMGSISKSNSSQKSSIFNSKPSNSAKTFSSSNVEEKVDENLINTLSAIMADEPVPAKSNYATTSKPIKKTVIPVPSNINTSSTIVNAKPTPSYKSYPKSSSNNNYSGNYNPSIPVAKTIPIPESELNKQETRSQTVYSRTVIEPTPIENNTIQNSSSIVFTPVTEPQATIPETIDYTHKEAEKISDFHMMDIKESDSESFWSPMAANEESLIRKATGDNYTESQVIMEERTIPETSITTTPIVTSPEISTSVTPAETHDLFTRESEYSKGDLLNLSTTTAIRTEVISPAPKENISSAWTGEIYSPKTAYIPPTTVIESAPSSSYEITENSTETYISEPTIVTEREVVSESPAVTIAPAAPSSHTVEKGDTLYNISRRYGLTVAELKSMNGLSDNVIKLGQSLRVL